MEDCMPYEEHSPDWVRERLSEWDNCAIADCPNKVCTWAHATLCYPCAERMLGKPAMRAAFMKTHPGPYWWSDVPGRL